MGTSYLLTFVSVVKSCKILTFKVRKIIRISLKNYGFQAASLFQYFCGSLLVCVKASMLCGGIWATLGIHVPSRFENYILNNTALQKKSEINTQGSFGTLYYFL